MTKIDALVIGGGPAGLMAARTLRRAGRDVVVAEAKPSAGRKLLMAGKSGLNLTKDEPLDQFLSAYGDAHWLHPMIKDFGPADAMTWAETLGQPIFTGSTGRVFPQAMKASPLLRAWLASFDADLRLRWRWTGFDGDGLSFDTPNGPETLTPRVTVLSLGGASWSRLGSDGAWASLLRDQDVDLTPFAPSNFGLQVDWSAHMAKVFGHPVKGISLRAEDHLSRGEIVISRHGLEGGGLYALSAPLRQGAALTLDLRPDLSVEACRSRLGRTRGKASLANFLRKTLKLDGAKLALLQELGRPLPDDPDALAARIKSLTVTHQGPRPMDQAISTTGGIAPDALTDGLMLKALPGIFAAGEMLDWDAPTGGYLLTACLATGQWAGRHAANYPA